MRLRSALGSRRAAGIVQRQGSGYFALALLLYCFPLSNLKTTKLLPPNMYLATLVEELLLLSLPATLQQK
jgi:hypothetical protein